MFKRNCWKLFKVLDIFPRNVTKALWRSYLMASGMFFSLPPFVFTMGQNIGDPLSPWTPGVLDIHQINTGSGNAALLVFPDGTSLLVDAGDGNPEPPRGAMRVPDGSRNAGEWIARYARKILNHDTEPAIDYALSTHFHSDHMGEFDESRDVSVWGDYKLTGFTEVAEYIPIRMMLDRGWPDYNYPRLLENQMMDNYRVFLDSQRIRRNMQVERLIAGRNDQIVLKRHPELYKTFQVRNIAVNGEVWTGVQGMTQHHFPKLIDTAVEDWPTENQCSMAIRVSYGNFDYYTGGDMPGEPDPGLPLWHGVEAQVAKVVGPVDAAVLHHHGLGDGTTESFVRALRARVWIIPTRAAGHPDRWVLNRLYSNRLYPDLRDVYALSLQPATRLVVGRSLRSLKSAQGHVVVRVDSGGDKYSVIVLDDSTEEQIVKAVFGPYDAR